MEGGFRPKPIPLPHGRRLARRPAAEQHRLMKLRLALAIALAMSASSARAEPQVGDIFDVAPGQTFRGATLVLTGIAPSNVTYAVFQSGRRYIIALTTPIATNPDGGVTAAKITRALRVASSPGEKAVPGPFCSFAGLDPAWAFHTRSTGIVRGYFVFPDEIRPKRWFVDATEDCGVPD